MEAERYARLHEVYEAVRHLPRADRPGRARSLCGDDPELLSEALQLIASEPRTGDGSDAFDEERLGAGRERLEAALDSIDKDAREAWLPERIGAYRIVRRIGEGGMGVVYLAEQESPRRQVAVKWIQPMALTTDERMRRFRQEAELLGRLHHPGIARIFEAGTFDLGRGPQPFFAMEYVEGLDLASHATSARLDVRARLELVARVADAAQHAHERGVVHRDLKPDNVLVRADGQPVVLDFGVARTTDAPTLLSTLETRTGELLGTLPYMAPEQLSGDPDAVTVRTDVYALGAIAFELLCDRTPHAIAGLPVTEAIRLKNDTDAPRIGGLDPTLRGDVETIVGKTLEREPARRYDTAAALAADIRRWLEHRPIVARPPSRLYLVRKFARRNRALVGGFLALAIGLVAATAFAVVARSQRDLATEAREETRGNLYLAHMLFASEAARDSGQIIGLRHFVDLWRDPGDLPDLRGWEWYHFAAAAEARERVLEVECQPLDLAWHPTRPWIALGGLNGTEIIAVPTGEQAAYEPRDPELGYVYDIAFSPSGDRLVLVGERGVRVQALASGGTLDSVWSHLSDKQVQCVAWHPGGDVIATINYDRVLETYAASDGTPLTSSEAPADRTFGWESGTLAYSPSGDRLAASIVGCAVAVLDAETLELVQPLGFERWVSTSVRAVTWDPSGERVAFCSLDGRVRAWDVAGGRELFARHAHPRGALRVSWSPDGERLLSSGSDKALRVWNTTAGAVTTVLRGHAGRIVGAEWSPDGATLASCAAEDGSLRLWPADESGPTQRIPFEDRRRTENVGPALAWHPNGRELYVHRLDNQRVMRLDRGVLVADESVPHLPAFGAWNADGELHAHWQDAELWIREAEDPMGRARTLSPPTAPWSIAWSPSDPESLGMSGEGGVWILDALGTRDPVHVLEADGVSWFGWSPGGKWIVVPLPDALHLVSRDGLVRRPGPDVPTERTVRAAFSPDGQRVACTLPSSRVIVLDVTSLSLDLEVTGLSHDPVELAWHPGGDRLALGSSDGTVKLVDTHTGELAASLEVGERVRAVTWSKDGEHLFALSTQGELRRWSATGTATHEDTAAAAR